MRAHLRIATAAVVALGVGLGACTGDDSAGPLGDIGSLQFAARLKPASNCDALLEHLRDEAAERVGPYGLNGGGVYAVDAMAAGADGRTRAQTAAPSAAETKGDAGSSTGAAPGYSTTNVQEVGIDEPDLVKTDGARILVVANGSFHVVDLKGAQPALVGSIELAGADFQPSEILVAGNRVLVFGTAGGFRKDLIEPAPRPGIAAGDIAPSGGINATITELDVSNQSAPKIVKRLEVEGDYVTARQIGTVARVVVRSYPQQLAFVYPQNESGQARAKQLNEETVRQSTLDDWLPQYRIADAAGKELDKGQLAKCTNVALPTEFAGFGTLSVLTFDLSKSIGNGDAVSVLSNGDTVYASNENLYVATTSYVEPEQQTTEKATFVAEFSTSIHAFDIRGNDPAEYLASGTVPGHLLNQFSMSEHEGHLRAATTNGAPWASGTDSSITVLRRDGERLVRVGQVSGMGKGERIYSVRYAGDTAYVVTFRQTDPFYTVDLSDPAAPRVVGELKIPGYSGYLHPIGETYVLGIGQDATAQGRVTGTKVSLFDVSDLANPTEIATWKQANSNTQAEFDHHAFLYWPERKIAVLPVFNYSGRGDVAAVSQAVVLSIDPQAGIREVGRISHAQSSPIVRSLVAADQLWTVSNERLQANAFADLAVTARIDL
jgi:uncharacterized secreted protein with C-terminal beta-propeller domain